MFTSLLAYTHPHTGTASNSLDQLHETEQHHLDTETPTLNVGDYDTVPEEHSSKLTAQDACTQAISELATSDKVVSDTTNTTDTEGSETQELRGQRERSAEGSSPTHAENDPNSVMDSAPRTLT